MSDNCIFHSGLQDPSLTLPDRCKDHHASCRGRVAPWTQPIREKMGLLFLICEVKYFHSKAGQRQRFLTQLYFKVSLVFSVLVEYVARLAWQQCSERDTLLSGQPRAYWEILQTQNLFTSSKKIFKYFLILKDHKKMFIISVPDFSFIMFYFSCFIFIFLFFIFFFFRFLVFAFVFCLFI